MTNRLAPVLLFSYKRLETLKRTVHALQNNYLAYQSELFIFSDGAKNQDDVLSIAEVRKYLNTITGFKSVTVHESPINKGLANSIIDGVNKVLVTYEHVIVVEDDLKTTPNFLTFMNSCLKSYKTDLNVFSISGYSFDLGIDPHDSCDTYFLNRGWSWGWATWQDRWIGIDWLIEDYSEFVNDNYSQREFAKGGSDLNGMLRKQLSGKLDSWAIRWFYNQFKAKGLTLYPVYSKVYNAGFDENATNNVGSSNRYISLMDTEFNTEFIFPSSTEVNSFYQKKFQYKMGILSRLRSKIEDILKLVKVAFYDVFHKKS